VLKIRGPAFTQKRRLGGLYGYLTLKLKLYLDAGLGRMYYKSVGQMILHIMH
jgi:hypothetical protein